MYWIDEVKEKIKRKNQILFSKDCEFLMDLTQFINEQNRRIVTLWALDLSKETAYYLKEKYPHENSPQKAVESAKLWAEGVIKMPQAKREILRCHAIAKTITNMEDIALFHAVGQGCSVVHTVKHAMGYPIYDLTAVVRRYGIDNCKEAVELRKCEYIEKLKYICSNYEKDNYTWAAFMLK